jgi:opacity protein-like surface antigen
MQHFRDKLARIAIAAVVIAFGMLLSITLPVFPAQASDPTPAPKTIAAPQQTVQVAQAAPTSWTGLYLGAGAGYAVGDTGVSVDSDKPYGPANILTLDGLSSDGWQGDGRIGFDWQVGSSPFVLGVLAGYGFGETEFRASAIDGLIGVNASITPEWYVGARGCYAFSKALGCLGYAYQHAKAKGSIGIGGGSASDSISIDGHSLLVSLEVQLTPQLSFGPEYTFTRYEDINIGPVTLEPEVHAFMLRGNWRPFGK